MHGKLTPPLEALVQRKLADLRRTLEAGVAEADLGQLVEGARTLTRLRTWLRARGKPRPKQRRRR